MSIKTKIQWCDSTVNPTLGCDGCELWSRKNGVQSCYAGVLTKRFGGSNPGLADDFNVVSTAPGRMAKAASWRDLTGVERTKKPWLNGLPRLIFVGDMADSLSADIAFKYLHDEVVSAVVSPEGERHQWLWLTKRPQRMAKFSRWLLKQSIPWPQNLWAGTSVTTQRRTNRIDALLDVGDEHTIRFVSVEPQWESVNLRRWLSRSNWVIQGGQSGSHDHPFAIEWADDLREQCRTNQVPYFLKQLGSCVTINDEKIRGHRGHGGDWEKWPRRLRVRQMPLESRKRKIGHGFHSEGIRIENV